MTRRRITAAVLLLLGLGFSAWSAGLVARARAASAWPSTTGTVTYADVEDATDPTDASPMYTARVRYSYQVGDRTYTGRRVTLADHSSSSRGAMDRIAARFPAGSRVAVYYDATEPASSVLDVRVPFVTWAPLALGVLASIAGALALVARPRRPRAGAQR